MKLVRIEIVISCIDILVQCIIVVCMLNLFGYSKIG